MEEKLSVEPLTRYGSGTQTLVCQSVILSNDRENTINVVLMNLNDVVE